MGFEFKLATTAPNGAGTTGVIRKYTPITYWMSDDKMKFSKNYGDDAWDSKSYLNIWLCNMQDALGYSTLPGIRVVLCVLLDSLIIAFVKASISSNLFCNNGSTDISCFV